MEKKIRSITISNQREQFITEMKCCQQKNNKNQIKYKAELEKHNL